jgi:hypothetical protein
MLFFPFNRSLWRLMTVGQYKKMLWYTIGFYPVQRMIMRPRDWHYNSIHSSKIWPLGLRQRSEWRPRGSCCRWARPRLLAPEWSSPRAAGKHKVTRGQYEVIKVTQKLNAIYRERKSPGFVSPSSPNRFQDEFWRWRDNVSLINVSVNTVPGVSYPMYFSSPRTMRPWTMCHVRCGDWRYVGAVEAGVG